MGFDRGDAFERIQSDLLRMKKRVRGLKLELDTMRRRAEKSEKKVVELETELMKAAKMVDAVVHAQAKEAETRIAARIIQDARQWGYDEPVVELSSQRSGALFASSKVLSIYNWLKQVEQEAKK